MNHISGNNNGKDFPIQEKIMMMMTIINVQCIEKGLLLEILRRHFQRLGK
jgi:hypothetical protein